MAAPSLWLLAWVVGSARATGSDSSNLPEFLSWRELQKQKVSSKPNCKCLPTSGLEALVQNVGGRLCLPYAKPEDSKNISTADPSICLPPDYGVGECRMWDAGVGQCATKDPKPWCFQLWCFVDPHQCIAGDVSPSVFFSHHAGSPHYSYMTCGLPAQDNPFFVLYVPTHLLVAATLMCIGVPGVAFTSWLVTSRTFRAARPLGLPWVLLWLTISVKWEVNYVQLHERVPNFPTRASTDRVFESIVLLFLLVLLHSVLAVINEYLADWRVAIHKEDGGRKEIQILESVLLYQKLHIDSWSDLVMRLWFPFYRVSQQVLVLVWVLFVLDVPVLSSWITTGFFSTLFLGSISIVYSLKDELLAVLMLAYEKPFNVADIISLHTVSNGQGVMSAVAVGFVERLGLAHIAIRNFDMRLQYVPTTAFARGTIRNWNARQYKLSHWTLVMSMKTPPETVSAFRDGVEKALKSHPSCKIDGYIKVCVKGLAEGGFLLEVVCFTKPHADHHNFKLDMNMTFSKLATRLGVQFMWKDISRESDNKQASFFQCNGEGVPETPQIDDLLFKGRFTKGSLIGKFKKNRWAKLAHNPDQPPTQASVSFDMLFSLPLTNPAVVADKEILWTANHPTLKGHLQVMVDEAMLKEIMPKGCIFGGSLEVVVMVTVVRKAVKPPGEAKGGSGEIVAVQCADDDIVANGQSNPQRLTKHGEATWGETLVLGEVEVERPGGAAGWSSVLQLAVGHKSSNNQFIVIGIAQMSLLELVQDAWKDQQVKVVTEVAKKNDSE